METIQDSYFLDDCYYADNQILSGSTSNHTFSI
jgi:hypothetical protein